MGWDPCVFAVSSHGHVYTLSGARKMWEELPYVGVEFKRVSSAPNCVWAVGGDHQVYVYIYGMDVPIRVAEEAYENERWNPVDGFCVKLLPTDRPRYSSVDGLQDRSLASIKLPTMAWQWEDDWHLDTTFDGETLDSEGWTYAIDYPRTYTAKKHWNSCVRRRRWVRYRHYVALDTWSAVPPVHPADYTKEPFIDIAVGGHQIHGADHGLVTVWGITVFGRVLRRTAVSLTNPEGNAWEEVPLPTGREGIQLSVGPTGLVWVVAWNGSSYVRTGVTRSCLNGEDWVEVDPPSPTCQLTMVSVGGNSVWAITRDHCVWFRRGYKREGATEVFLGNSWVLMVGEMTVVSVSAENQVFSLKSEESCFYIREGVNSSESSGTGWHAVRLLTDSSESSDTSESTTSRSSSKSSLNIAPSAGDAPEDSLLLGRDDDAIDGGLMAPIHSSLFCWVWIDAGACMLESPALSSFLLDSTSTSEQSLVISEAWRGQLVDNLHKRNCTEIEPYSKNYEAAIDRPSWIKEAKVRWSSDCFPPQWREGLLRMEWSGSEHGTASFGSLVISTKGKTSKKLPQIELKFSDITCVENCGDCGGTFGGASSTVRSFLVVHTAQFSTSRTPLLLAFGEDCDNDDWLANLSHACCQLRGWDRAPLPGSIWASTSRGDVFLHDYSSNNEDNLNSGTLETIDISTRSSPYIMPLSSGLEPVSSIRLDGHIPLAARRVHINLECGAPPPLPKQWNHPHRNVALHISVRLTDKSIVFNSMRNGRFETEEKAEIENSDGNVFPYRSGDEFQMSVKTMDSGFEIWSGNAKLYHCNYRSDVADITHLSITGDVKMHRVVYQIPSMVLSAPHLFWRQVGGHLRLVETCPLGITWGITYDHKPWVHTYGWGGAILRGLSGGGAINPVSDTRCVHVYENQRWNPLGGFTARGLPTDRYMWSDRSGRRECLRENTRPPSHHWQWVTDWLVDLRTPGGVDEDGWQYATDFPAEYHGYKGFVDYVRRRRWMRRCRLNTTGPWHEVKSTGLISISVTEMPRSDDMAEVWAISVDGDALYREGVTVSNPEGSHWTPAPHDRPFVCISVGAPGQVWAIGKDGTAYVRLGVSRKCPIGTQWYHVDRPKKSTLLIQISVGGGNGPSSDVRNTQGSVWAVSECNSLYIRLSIQQGFPEGLSWKRVCGDVRQVSVSPNDQVWAIRDNLSTKWGYVSGVVCRRTGISINNPGGSSWDCGIGGGWQHISVRGLPVRKDSK